MKSTPLPSIFLSLSLLAGAIPTTSNQGLRIPLQRRSHNATDSTLVHSSTGGRFLGAQRVANMISYTHEKYANTFAAYERNTGSRHPLDTRPRSSSVNPSKRASRGDVDLTNQDVELWYGLLTIGTPPQDFTVDFDTGSADLIIPDKDCVDCLGHRMYDSSKSSTSHPMVVPFNIIYGSGAMMGTMYSDKVRVGEYEIAQQGFGGANAESPQFFSIDFAPDGICGLGFEDISATEVPTLMDSLKTSGLLPQPVFSFKLSSSPGESNLIIGDVDYTAFKSDTLESVPVTERGYWQVVLDDISSPSHAVEENMDAIIDTGTTLILGPRDMVDDYFSDIPGAECGPDGVCTVPCNIIDTTAPTLSFGGGKFTVSPATWNLGPSEPGSPNCIAGLGIFFEKFMVVGDVFLQNVYTIFDFSDDPKVQFGELV